MPNRGHRSAGGVTRTHARTNSGGSSKLGLNLQLTQKDVPPPRLPDKSKKNAHIHHEPTARSSAQISRTGSSHRIPSREHVQPALLRRAPPPLTAGRPPNGRQKVDFRISSPSEGDEEDEWVSSESGAATPNTASADSDTEEARTPVEPTKPSLPPLSPHVNGFLKEDVETPKAEMPPLPRADTFIPSQPSSPAPAPRDHSQHPLSRTSIHPQQSECNDQRFPQTERMSEQSVPPFTKARSETHSPSRSSSPPKRQSMTRPPSTHSVASRFDLPLLRPHPLIRGHSYGSGAFTATPAPLAPLTMVSSDAAQAQMSTASSPSSLRAGSPSSIKTASASPNQSSPSSSQAHRQLRRTSTSSVRSTATVPVQSSASQAQLNRSTHDRQRTLSTISSNSSFAALSNALRSTPSPPRTPVQFTSHFSPVEQSAGLEAVHPLLPPPYLSAHITVLAYRNPIAESYDRVIRAKQAR
ncbi:uncharacterized protein FIBRA_02093 [Fibroporia radiculosa]|uniref:Uncharacterized protein n=1 Tax=Fibroporia radiculosa TaxID=599839 RepID=J4I8V4_9APHY|nr:uncharacterized protein FIBRA_02093 [Fibroporia radiculosa]CCM00066.1 predicted protein [Fibroporia radiculosa]